MLSFEYTGELDILSSMALIEYTYVRCLSGRNLSIMRIQGISQEISSKLLDV